MPDILSCEIPAYWFEAHSQFSRRAAFYLWHGLASSTRKTYSSGQRSYIDFVRVRPPLLHAPGQYLPATNQGILEWVTSLGDRALLPKTIKSYISSVRSLHVDAGLPFECCESPTVQRLVRGIKRFYGERVRTPKLPVTLPILRKLTSVSGDLSLRDNLNFDAAIKIAWSGFLRCGEFTVPDGHSFDPAVHLTRSSITFIPSIGEPTHIRLTLPSSKTDPFRKGVSILVAKALSEKEADSTCAVLALRRLFLQDPQPSSNSPLFTDGTGSPLSRNSFISLLKIRLAAIGLDQARYSGHSFRRGAATSAATVGYSDYEIQLLGRWRSDAYKLYIDVPDARILHLSSRLHVATAPAPVPDPPALPFAPVLA